MCKEGNRIDPKKVEAVVHWLRLTSVTEIRSFLGLAGYYRKFIKDFFRIATLTKLTKKYQKYEWEEAYEQSFQKLKNCLTSDPVLALSTDTGDFTVYYDASKISLDYVLMQNGEKLPTLQGN